MDYGEANIATRKKLEGALEGGEKRKKNKEGMLHIEAEIDS